MPPEKTIAETAPQELGPIRMVDWQRWPSSQFLKYFVQYRVFFSKFYQHLSCLSPTSKSGQFQISPAVSPEIEHHAVWRTWRLIASTSDERWLYYQFSLPHSVYISLQKVGRIYTFLIWECKSMRKREKTQPPYFRKPCTEENNDVWTNFDQTVALALGEDCCTRPITPFVFSFFHFLFYFEEYQPQLVPLPFAYFLTVLIRFQPAIWETQATCRPNSLISIISAEQPFDARVTFRSKCRIFQLKPVSNSKLLICRILQLRWETKLL